MLKTIGIILFIAGLSFAVFTLFMSKRQGIREAEGELKLLLSQGYVSEHREASAPAMLLNEAPIKVPERQRALSKDALALLEQVEAEREQEARDNVSKKLKKDGTDVFIDSKPSIRLSAPKKTASTAILPDRATDVMLEENVPKSKGTGILPSEDAPKHKGTDILPDSNDTYPKQKGTDILQDHSANFRFVDPPKVSKGTDILPEAKSGTDILPDSESGSGTAILQDASGTDILPEEPGSKGTAILKEE